MTELENSTIYVELDALFDTRAGTLASFGTEASARAILKGYYQRQVDVFEGIDPDEFKTRYAARDRITLKNSLVSPIVRQIQRFVHQTVTAAINSPYRRQAKVVLNTYPYILTPDDELSIITGLIACTNELADIELVYLPLSEITPDYVKAHYVRMIMYAYWDWLEVHSVTKALADSRCQTVSLFGPQLVKSLEAEKQLRGINAYAAIEELTGRFIQLCLLPISEYCVDLVRLEEQARASAARETPQ